ncbi:MAG: CHAT domain-containing protein [Planctomycetota bacterium]
MGRLRSHLPFLLLALASRTLHAADSAARSESEGIARASEARKAYVVADRLWQNVATAAAAAKDDESRVRVARRRKSIAAARLHRRGYEDLGGRPVAAWPVSAPSGEAARLKDWKRLGRLFSIAAGRAQREPDHDPRDVVLLREARAILATVEADVAQAEADDSFRRALRSLGTGTEPRVLASRVRLHYYLREFDAALRLADSSTGNLATIGGDPKDDRSYCAHLRRLYECSLFLGRKDVATRLATYSENCEKSVQSPLPTAIRDRRLGSSEDLIFATKALVGLQRTYRFDQHAQSLLAYFAASSAMQLGKIALAERLLDGQRVLLEDSWLRASIASRLAACRERLGDFEGATRALDLAARSGAKFGAEFATRLDLQRCRVSIRLGKYREGEALARQILARRVDDDTAARARILIATCWFEQSTESPEKLVAARKILRSVEATLAKLPDTDARRELRVVRGIQLANLLRSEAKQSGDATLRARATKIQHAAMNEAHNAGFRELTAIAAGNLGELHLEAGSLKEAREFANWSLKQAKDLRSYGMEWRATWYLARIADLEKRPHIADGHLQRAIEIVESYRERILGAGTKVGFMADKMDLFRYAVDRALRARKLDRAFELVERSRAQALVESLGWRFVTLANGKDAELYQSFVDLVAREERLRDSKRTAGRLYGVRDSSKENHDAVRLALGAKRKEILESSTAGPAVKAIVDGAPLSPAEVQRRVASNATLIEFFDAGSSLVAFVVTGSRGVRAVRLQVTHRDLVPRVKRFLRSGAGDPEIAKELHRQILAPIEPLVSTERVIVVPYGVLHGLPLEALKGPRGFQLERWQISYLPSASVLRFLDGTKSPRSNAPLKLLALADPDTDYDGDGIRDKVALSGARQEVEAFAKRFDAPRVLFGEHARESALRSELRSADVVHVACHGAFYPARPWDSTLFLAKGAAGRGAHPSAGDGYFRAREVYGLDLRGLRLVALSGCETGVADVAGGDDPAGLATAFLHSGAPALLVSLWKVDDRATSQLMQTFYRKWIDEKLDRSRALREAKLELLRGEFRDPKLWAAFVLVAER